MTASYSKNSPASVVRKLVQSVLIDPTSATRLSLGDLDLLLRAMRRVRLLGWLAVELERAGATESLPGAAAEQLSSALIAADARARISRWEMNRIEWAMRDKPDVRIIALKGCAYLLRNLPNAAGRYFADVDLLVAEDDLDAIESALSEHGWHATKLSPYDQNFYRAWSHELPAMVHEEREVEVDVHHNLIGRFARFKPEACLLLGQAQRVEGSSYWTLSDVDIVLHAMTHLMYGGDLADDLRDLVDIDAMVGRFVAADARFWERLSDRAAELDLSLPAYYSVRYLRRFLGTPVPDPVVASLSQNAPPRFVVGLMDRIVPMALFPQHPDCHTRRAGIARWLLYARSHWVSMPPIMLLRHLTYKFYVRHLEWRFKDRN